MRNIIQEYSVFSQYFAPSDKNSLLFLGEQISQRHMYYGDKLIGIVGDAGSGKSSLIKGMFPGLELSNDDDTLNSRKIMQVRDLFDDVYEAATYHVDTRFQMAFTQMHEIVMFVQHVLAKGRRVVIEHFDLLYPYLGINADLIVGIGEEIIVTRPNMFGPLPQSIYEIVSKSLHYRKMAHTVEDITILVLMDEFGITDDMFFNADMRNGFVLKFFEEIEIDFDKLYKKVREILDKNLIINYYDENNILIGDRRVPCKGPRIHIRNTSEVKEFCFIKKLIKDHKTNTYCLIGSFTDNPDVDISNWNTIHFLKRKDS